MQALREVSVNVIDVGVRTSSFAASAALLGAAVIAAMSMSFTIMRSEPVLSGPVVEVVEPLLPPAPPTEASPAPIRTGELTIASIDAPSASFEANTLSNLGDVAVATDIGPPVITNPHWRHVPSDLARYYPRRALARAVEGEVVLDCLVAVSGRLNCGVAQESPAGWNFGDAAMRIAAEHQMAPAMRDGVAVEGRYRMRVPFELQ